MQVPYKIYKREDVQEGISDKNERIVFFKNGFYECMLVINPYWSGGTRGINDSIVGHLDFYATSEGWEEYTSTGYHSTFFYHSDAEQYKNDDFVIQEFKVLLKRVDFIFEKSIQTSLF